MPAEVQDRLIDQVVLASVLDTLILSRREHALLDYADRLTREPWTIGAHHVDGLREVGCDDRAVHDACAIVAYFAFVNRIADGLGVELEDPTAG